MKIRIKGFKRLLVESALIVFSVLFALFINRYAENQKVRQQKQVALERIVQEMKSNREIVTEVIQTHRRVSHNLQKANTNENDSLRIYLADQGYFSPEVLTLIMGNETFFPQFPSNTAWQAALATGIISEFDYDVVESLAATYDQRFFIESTLESITEVIYSPINEKESQTLNALLLQINELVSQQERLVLLIDDALETIQPDTTEKIE